MDLERPFIVAIDGPGGSGKTTVARAVAMALGLPHLDTGAYYRAATVAVLRRDVDPADAEAVCDVVEDVEFDYTAGRMTLDGDDVSEAIRSDEVTAAVSAVSAVPDVRRRLVDAQRSWVDRHGGSGVVEGRDIGTVVFPGADLKIFLTARPEVRAARRAAETGDVPVDAVQSDLERRDQADAGRAIDPLRRADDAVVVDTSDLGVDEVIASVVGAAEARRR